MVEPGHLLDPQKREKRRGDNLQKGESERGLITSRFLKKRP